MNYTAHADTFARDSLPPKNQWPDLMFELPQLQYPRRLNCAAELLDKMVALGHGERTVIRTLIDGKAYSCTYGQLLHRANRIARVLAEDMGLKPGHRVLLRAPNNPMMAACCFAVIKAGLIAVPTMALLRATELRQIIDKVVAPAVNLFLAPALDQVMPDANLVEHARDDEIDYRRHTLRPVVEARVRGEDDGAGVRELEHGLEMDG